MAHRENNQNKREKRGTIKFVNGDPNPNSYVVKEDATKEEYVIHIGDISENEQVLYELQEMNQVNPTNLLPKVTRLNKGDRVEFDLPKNKNAIRVKKIEN